MQCLPLLRLFSLWLIPLSDETLIPPESFCPGFKAASHTKLTFLNKSRSINDLNTVSQVVIMKKKINKIIQIKDRKLGNEWLDWQGNIQQNGMNANTGKRIFLGVILTTIILLGCLGFFVWYMVSPRLSQYHPQLPVFFAVFLGLFWGLIAFWFLLMVLSILMEKDIFMRLGGKEFSLTFLVPIALRFGVRIGISKDKMGQSFVKVSNILIRTSARRVKPEKLLILLPRCLQKSLIEKITKFSKELNIAIYIVSGGEKAREVIDQTMPKAIIGVACERDLLSGIQEVLSKIPVIGIPNIRPEGPCKNTVIDMNEFEKAVQTFLGPDITIA